MYIKPILSVLVFIALISAYYLYINSDLSLQIARKLEEETATNTPTQTASPYNFDIPETKSLSLRAETNEITNETYYKISYKPTGLGSDRPIAGDLFIVPLGKTDWKDFFIKYQGEKGMGFEKFTLEDVDKYFSSTESCDKQKDVYESPCKGVNKNKLHYVRFLKPYDRGMYSPGVYYIFKHSDNTQTIAFFTFTPRYEDFEDTLIFQEIIETIR